MKPCTLLVFPGPLGWMAMIASGATVRQLTFGHPTATAARAAVNPALLAEYCRDSPKLHRRVEALLRRLRGYASGTPDDFRDVHIDPGPLSRFQQRVFAQCRRVHYGSTISYAALATRAGYPGAARAVGNCMAGNWIPLIVPCHRVVCSDGRLGSYSAPGGTKMKHRLLTLESQHT